MFDDLQITRQDFRRVTGLFDEVWEVFTPQEKCQVVETMIDHITYDGGTGKLDIKLSPTGIHVLANNGRREN